MKSDIEALKERISDTLFKKAVYKYAVESGEPHRFFDLGSPEFKSKFIKVWHTDKHINNIMPLNVGVKENIKSQWNEHSKAFGMASRRAYLFGSTTDFSMDHVYIVDEMTKMLDEPTMMFSIDASGSKVSLYIHPAHRGIIPETDFEKAIVYQILSEAKEAFAKMPQGKRFQADIEFEFLDKEDSTLTRAISPEELEKMIGHLKK